MEHRKVILKEKETNMNSWITKENLFQKRITKENIQHDQYENIIKHKRPKYK